MYCLTGVDTKEREEEFFSVTTWFEKLFIEDYYYHFRLPLITKRRVVRTTDRERTNFVSSSTKRLLLVLDISILDVGNLYILTL